ncbi:MAG: hypothetical protein CVV60_00505 [Tenericutes bacterium HGW-Tenericutes-5]|jgi:hypothetical protein|nr:MAG: hypothetical protein CVV60_00505 [Tenericutes bacterium HGW-Tenericutes-5]
MIRKIFVWIIVAAAGIATAILTQYNIGEYHYLLMFTTFITFNVISLIFYRESKMITGYHAMTIVSLFGYFMLYQLAGRNFSLLGIISFLGSFITVLIAFGVVLQNKTYKLNERSFMWFAVYGFIFFSLYQPFILNLITNFFGPDPVAIDRTVDTFFLLRTILIGVNVVLQLIIVHNNELHIFFEKNKRPLVNAYNIDDLPFFKK